MPATRRPSGSPSSMDKCLLLPRCRLLTALFRGIGTALLYPCACAPCAVGQRKFNFSELGNTTVSTDDLKVCSTLLRHNLSNQLKNTNSHLTQRHRSYVYGDIPISIFLCWGWSWDGSRLQSDSLTTSVLRS